MPAYEVGDQVIKMKKTTALKQGILSISATRFKHSRKKMAALVLLNISIVLCALQFLISKHWEADQPRRFVTRAAQMLNHLSTISKTPEDTTLFFGHSIFQFFLNPVVLDEVYHDRGLPSVSYNMSMSGNMGLGQYTQVLRMAQEFSRNKRKFRATIFEFSPIAYSSEFHNRHQFRLNQLQPRVFFHSSILGEMLKLDPFMALSVALNYYVRPVHYRVLFPFANWRALEMPKRSGVWAGITTLFDESRFFDKYAWSLELRGTRNWGLPATKDDFERTLSSFHQPGAWEFAVNQYRGGNSVDANFKFDLRALDLFVSSLQIAKHFSENVCVLILPSAPALEVFLDEFVDSNGIIESIRARSGAEILDLRKVFPVQDSDFADPLHPRHETMNRFVKVLADRLIQEGK